MPTKRTRRARQAIGRLTDDQVNHLLGDLVLDVCQPWYRKLGFPFRDEADRRQMWEEHREYVLSKCPPGTVADAAREYDGDDRDLPSVLHYYAMRLGEVETPKNENRIAEVIVMQPPKRIEE